MLNNLGQRLEVNLTGNCLTNTHTQRTDRATRATKLVDKQELRAEAVERR